MSASFALILSMMNGRASTGDEERENVEWLGELVRALTGLNEHGEFDPDVARRGRAVAFKWLRENELIKS